MVCRGEQKVAASRPDSKHVRVLFSSRFPQKNHALLCLSGCQNLVAVAQNSRVSSSPVGGVTTFDACEKESR